MYNSDTCCRSEVFTRVFNADVISGHTTKTESVNIRFGSRTSIGMFISKSDFNTWWLDERGWISKVCFLLPCSWMSNAVLPDFFFSSPSKRPRSVMAKYYLLDSYSVGVESGWGSQMVGVFDSPDGCSVWCSVTLGRLIDMLPLPPLHLFASSSFTSSPSIVTVTKMDTSPLASSCRSWEDGMGLST